MDRERLKDLFRRMLAGDLEAARRLDECLYGRQGSGERGDAVTADALTTLVYDLCYEYVQRRMHKDFRFLVDRHSAADVLHNAWVRVLGPSALPAGDLPALCRRICHMARYALLEAVRSQRRWDRDGTTGGDAGPDPSLGRFEDGGSWDPGRLAVWTGFHEQVEKLPDDEREVFKLHYYLGMSRRTTADQLGLTEDRVRQLLLLAKESLGRSVPGAP